MLPDDRIIVFSLNRSGTSVLYRLCHVLAHRAGYKHYSLPRGDVIVHMRQLAEQSGHWLNQPGCFGPLRMYIPTPRMEDARILLHLRDPRDVLVSMFFSYCYSHGGEIEGDTGYRREVAERGIDEFVCRMATAEVAPVTGDYGTGSHLWDLAGNVRQRYENYVSNILDRPNVVFVRYEDMVSDPTSWARAVSSVFGFEGPEQSVLSWRIGMDLASNSKVDREDRWAHKRQIAPGDHERKLRAKTIDQLNDAFGDVLTRLGYSSP